MSGVKATWPGKRVGDGKGIRYNTTDYEADAKAGWLGWYQHR